MPPNLDWTVLIPFMPDVVKAELRFTGAPDVAKWGPLFTNWVETSEHPRVIAWRDGLRRLAQKRYRAAQRRQPRLTEIATAIYGKQNGSIRLAGVLDPVLRDFNEDCFRGDARKRTKKEDPKLFIQT